MGQGSESESGGDDEDGDLYPAGAAALFSLADNDHQQSGGQRDGKSAGGQVGIGGQATEEAGRDCSDDFGSLIAGGDA